MRTSTKKAQAITAVDDLHAVHRFTLLTLTTAAIFLLLMNPVFAQDASGAAAGGSPMGTVLCRAVGLVMGDLGRGLATLAVIAVGVGAMIGKASWGMALTVAAGIGVVFGAPDIVYSLGVQAGGCAGGGMLGAYGGYGSGGAGYGAANDACYKKGADGAKNTMTDIKCGASALTDITGGLFGKANADENGALGAGANFFR